VLSLLAQLGSFLSRYRTNSISDCGVAMPSWTSFAKREDVNAVRKPHGVYGAKRVTLMISDDLQNASAETLQRFCAFVFSADPCKTSMIEWK